MPKMWSTPHNMNRCPVRLFEAFASKRPPDMCYPEAPFYLAINYNHTIHGFWYKNQKMGIQRIGVIMKKMASYSCSSGKKTNHSARKTMITALVKNDIPETQIIQLSGHKNLHSLNSYKKASMEQQKDMSHILSSYSLPGQASKSIKDNSAPLPLHSYFAGAQLTGCTINIGLPSTSTASQQNITIDSKK